MAESGFDISKYIKAEDIVAAVAAGVVAYIRNRPKVDDKKQQPPGDAAQAAQQAAPTPKGPTWGSQDWRDEMVRQGKLVQRDGIYFRVNRSGQPLEAYKFFKGGSYAKLPIEDADPLDIGDGSEGWWNFDKAKAILVSPDGSKQPLDGDYIGRLEGVLDKHFGDGKAMQAVGVEVRRAAAAASGLDPEVAAARGLHDGTGKAFTSAANTASAAPATGAPAAGAPTIKTGFSAANLPKRFDTSANAQRFWLEHPDLAKANGITITGRSASTAFSPTGYTRRVSGTISHINPAVKAKLDADNAAVRAAMDARAAEVARLQAAYQAAKNDNSVYQNAYDAARRSFGI